MPTASGKDLYFVAVKIFLRKGDRLLILKDSFGQWDLPGGRIKPDEFRKPLAGVLARKMKEELGPVRYRLGAPVVFMRHERRENGRTARIFAIGYEGRWTGGEVRLSERHPRAEWVKVAGFHPGKYFKGGWLEGVRDYLRTI